MRRHLLFGIALLLILASSLLLVTRTPHALADTVHNAPQFAQLTPTPDAGGFASYRATDLRQAVQVSESFTVRMKNGDLVTGKAGDYLVRSADSAWVVDRDIFESSYEQV